MRSNLARVVDEGLEGDVVGVDFELEVRLWVVGAAVDEGFHDFVLVDGVVGGLGAVEVEVGLVVGGEGEMESKVIVAGVNLRQWEVGAVWDRGGILNCAFGWAGGNRERGNGFDVSDGGDQGGGDEDCEIHFVLTLWCRVLRLVDVLGASIWRHVGGVSLFVGSKTSNQALATGGYPHPRGYVIDPLRLIKDQ